MRTNPRRNSAFLIVETALAPRQPYLKWTRVFLSLPTFARNLPLSPPRLSVSPDSHAHHITVHDRPRRGLAARQRIAVSLAPRSVKVVLNKTSRSGAKVMAADDDKPKILRKNEKEAWLSEMEKEGKNPLTDPMAMVAIGGITVPFIILAIAGAAGYIGQ